MSQTLMALHEMLQHSSHLVADGHGVENPDPMVPAGAKNAAHDIMGYIKWGSFFMIIAGGFVGAGALVGGKILGHHKSASIGTSILMVAALAAVIWGAIYGFLTGLA